MFTITDVMSEEECYNKLREIRWPDGVICPHCQSMHCEETGRASNNKSILRYRCHSCKTNFNDLTKTMFQSSHVNLKRWLCCLYLMGLNVSNSQIAQELNVSKRTAHYMCEKLRQKVLEKRPAVQLSGEVELDEVYVVAGHKGHPEAVKSKGRKGRPRRLKGARGRGTLAKEKPPILGILERGGEVVIRMLENVQQVTIQPIIQACIQPGTQTYTDEYDIYYRMEEWGYPRQSVCHSKGEYARDDDGDGFCEVHVNTIEGFWSLLRSWLRPHRGISQEKLPLYLAFFETVHNIRKRGKQMLAPMLQLILA